MIPNFPIKIMCKDQYEADTFRRLCVDQDIPWASGDRADRRAHPNEYPVYFYTDNGRLKWGEEEGYFKRDCRQEMTLADLINDTIDPDSISSIISEVWI